MRSSLSSFVSRSDMKLQMWRQCV